MQVHCPPNPLQFLVLLAILFPLFVVIRTCLMPQTFIFMCFFLQCFLPFPFPGFVHLGLSCYPHPLKQLLPSHYQPIPEVSKVYSLQHLIYKFATLSPSSFLASTQERSLLVYKNSDHVLLIPLWVSFWTHMKTILLQVFNNLSFYLDQLST